MESLPWFVGPAVLLGLVLVALWARGRDGSVEMPQAAGAAQSVEDLIAGGRKIDAIKLYRRQHGVGLREAKDAVEAIAQGLPS